MSEPPASQTPLRALALVRSLKPSPAPSYNDLDEVPEAVASATAAAARNAAHLARTLKTESYPRTRMTLLHNSSSDSRAAQRLIRVGGLGVRLQQFALGYARRRSVMASRA
jgi:hypothetical protein